MSIVSFSFFLFFFFWNWCENNKERLISVRKWSKDFPLFRDAGLLHYLMTSCFSNTFTIMVVCGFPLKLLSLGRSFHYSGAISLHGKAGKFLNLLWYYLMSSFGRMLLLMTNLHPFCDISDLFPHEIIYSPRCRCQLVDW